MNDVRADVFQKLLSRTYQLNHTGSLAKLRVAAMELKQSSPHLGTMVDELAGYAHLCGFNLSRENGPYAARYFRRSRNPAALMELHRIALMYHQSQTADFIAKSGVVPQTQLSEAAPVTWRFSQRDTSEVNRLFTGYCESKGLVILKILQTGLETTKRCSWVYLVWDLDDIVKVYKEVLDYNRGPLTGMVQSEDALYALLPQNRYFPRLYETLDIAGVRFMRQSVHFGQTVADFINSDSPLGEEDAGTLIKGVAEALNFAHINNIAYLDVKPENMLVGQDGILSLDLGISRQVMGDEEVDIYLADPRFGTPECATRLKGSKAADVFQTGILFHMLLTGKHPFETIPFEVADTYGQRESSILRYFCPTSVLIYQETASAWKGKHSELICGMLERDPDKRPTANEVVERLSGKKQFVLTSRPWKSSRLKTHNTVLFPARMGIPHKGHVEYISRVLELGYHVLISIEHTHTITDRDPIPKSLVMKIVAQSLTDRGFVPGVDFSFIPTPLYDSLAELEYHYYSAPQADDVIAVASDNPDVHRLFAGWTIFNQQSVFGTEGHNWQSRSWGETLRGAFRSEDYALFKQFAAEGTEKIVSFAELKAMYGKPTIDFAKSVDVVLLSGDKEIVRGRVFRYHFPEQSLVMHIKNNAHWDIKITNPYTRHTTIEVSGKTMQLCLSKIEFDKDTLHESIYFTLESV
jgi:serine/threonine protein kinase